MSPCTAPFSSCVAGVPPYNLHLRWSADVGCDLDIQVQEVQVASSRHSAWHRAVEDTAVFVELAAPVLDLSEK